MPLRAGWKVEKTEIPLPESAITVADFEKKLDQWEPVTLTLLQSISEVSRKIDSYYELIKEGTVTGAEIRGWLTVHLKLPLEAYQKTIYTSYKVFLQNIAYQMSENKESEAKNLSKQAIGILNTLKHFDINAKIITSICENVFKITDNLAQQHYGVEQVFKTRLPELLKQVTRQHEDMHALVDQYKAVQALLEEKLKRQIEEATRV
jgi:CII-binding regulator of phage lambda lysogenization HflD